MLKTGQFVFERHNFFVLLRKAFRTSSMSRIQWARRTRWCCRRGRYGNIGRIRERRSRADRYLRAPRRWQLWSITTDCISVCWRSEVISAKVFHGRLSLAPSSSPLSPLLSASSCFSKVARCRYRCSQQVWSRFWGAAIIWVSYGSHALHIPWHTNTVGVCGCEQFVDGDSQWAWMCLLRASFLSWNIWRRNREVP